MSTFKRFLADEMKDPEFAFEYAKVSVEEEVKLRQHFAPENSPESYTAWDGTKRPWHYQVEHPTDASCYDCHRPYEAIGDCSVDYEVWKRIAPTSHGGGILCPNCMLERLHHLGLSNIPAVLW